MADPGDNPITPEMMDRARLVLVIDEHGGSHLRTRLSRLQSAYVMWQCGIATRDGAGTILQIHVDANIDDVERLANGEISELPETAGIPDGWIKPEGTDHV